MADGRRETSRSRFRFVLVNTRVPKGNGVVKRSNNYTTIQREWLRRDGHHHIFDTVKGAWADSVTI